MTFSTDLNSTHQTNLLTLLTRRLEVAKAHHNQQLVAALEREYAQLTERHDPRIAGSWLQRLWLSFAETLSDWTRVHIEQTVDAEGKPSWYAYNPQAGQAISTHSKAEMQQWIKTTYWDR
ncbi:MAG: hypothetical protein WBB01_09120 [Phormidesmis sp.]